MTWFLIGLAVLWMAPSVATLALTVRFVREDRAERREFEQEVRALEAIRAEPFDPRVHGRADHLRI